MPDLFDAQDQPSPSSEPVNTGSSASSQPQQAESANSQSPVPPSTPKPAPELNPQLASQSVTSQSSPQLSPQSSPQLSPQPDFSEPSEHSVEKSRIKKKYSVRNPEEYVSLLKMGPKTTSPIAAYHTVPSHVRFSTQASAEIVLLLLRQHPVTQLGWILVALIAGFIPLLFTYSNLFDLLPLSYRIGIVALWYLGLFGFIFESFIKWFYNVYIITDERIVDIDFHSLTYRDISAAAIDKIEDTTASTAGLLSALFDYGTVTIQTAAEKREFEFAGIPHPSKVTSIINDLIIEEEREKIEGRVN